MALPTCCHNPTGADLTPAEWDQVIEVLKAKDLIPFLDIAYQGFGQGIEEDAYLIRALDQAGLNFIVSNSFSKIFSLYGERVGGLTFVCDDQATAQKVLGQLKATENHPNPYGLLFFSSTESLPTLNSFFNPSIFLEFQLSKLPSVSNNVCNLFLVF